MNTCHQVQFKKNLMNRFTEIWAQKWLISPIFEITVFLKNPNCHFQPFLNTCHQIQFQKNLMSRFKEKFKDVDFGPKITHLAHFEDHKIFLKKSYFYPFSKACNQIKFQKNLEKTLKSVDFRPQNSWLTPFWA